MSDSESHKAPVGEGRQRLRGEQPRGELQALARSFRSAHIFARTAEFTDSLRPLAGPEQAAVRGACEKRQREFRAGRHCAHAALLDVGQAVEALHQQVDRQPEWPGGVVGSISHAGGLRHGCAIATVASRAHFRGLGVDIETDRALGEELWDTILTEDEQRELSPLCGEARGRAALRHFSAKEAVFKAQYPTFECFLSFHDVQLRWHDEVGQFSAETTRPQVNSWLRRYSSEGRFYRCPPWVLSLFTVAGT